MPGLAVNGFLAFNAPGQGAPIRLHVSMSISPGAGIAYRDWRGEYAFRVMATAIGSGEQIRPSETQSVTESRRDSRARRVSGVHSRVGCTRDAHGDKGGEVV